MYLIKHEAVAGAGQGLLLLAADFLYRRPDLHGTSLLENYDRNGKLYHTNWSIHTPVDYKGEKTLLRFAFAFSLGMDWQNNHASPDIGYDLKMDNNAPGQ